MDKMGLAMVRGWAVEVGVFSLVCLLVACSNSGICRDWTAPRTGRCAFLGDARAPSFSHSLPSAAPVDDEWPPVSVDGPPRDETDKLDLLFMIDNSGSMRDKQQQIISQITPPVEQLLNPPCISTANTSPHPCSDPLSPGERRIFRPLRDLRVAVISSDLGTPGSTVPGCDDSDFGDNGRLNPIRNGPALASHRPWAPLRPNAEQAPREYRPESCGTDENRFPPFISFCSNTADPSCLSPLANGSTRELPQFVDWFRCNAGLFINGCGLEAPLESVWRALIENDARDVPDNLAPNAGFLRTNAVLAIVVLTDEEDGSVRNCRHDLGFSNSRDERCVDATDIYNTASANWAHPTNPDLRFYLYGPGSSLDPTWNLDRYYNTRFTTATTGESKHWERDLLSLKPDRPEWIIFAAIVGVPLHLPTRQTLDLGRPTLHNWDEILGVPHANGVNDFYYRDSSRAVAGVQDVAGPFSMRHANQDPNCTHMVPACRDEGTRYDAARSCSNAQYMAFPSRRVAEIVRRFDEYPSCHGSPCRNGLLSSICEADYGHALSAVATRIQQRFRLTN